MSLVLVVKRRHRENDHKTLKHRLRYHETHKIEKFSSGLFPHQSHFILSWYYGGTLVFYSHLAFTIFNKMATWHIMCLTFIFVSSIYFRSLSFFIFEFLFYFIPLLESITISMIYLMYLSEI